MSKKNLVIVESPTKAKTIGKILGDKFRVVSSMGHLIDLPKTKLGVDIEAGFKPEYVVIAGRQKVVSELKKESKEAESIYVATDPDREGEAIGWQLKERLFKGKKVKRVIFHEITPAAISEAFKNPRDFDQKLIEAQAGRRILDRIVGYFLSPLLWKKIARGLSAGRVQSVALKLVIDREKQIKGFNSKEYWGIEAELKKVQSSEFGVQSSFAAKLDKIADKKAEIKNKTEADRIVSDIDKKPFVVSDIKNTEKKRNPDPPFITSTLQQEAFNKLGFNGRRTMMIAQELYEGVDIGTEGPTGLITYMRTDSTNVSAIALKEVRNFISKEFGKDYLPKVPNVYKAKKFAQEAHEAIRPSLVGHSPESLISFLSEDQHKLYSLIYNRFIASQMNPALFAATTVSINSGNYLFSASGSKMIFAGFTKVYSKDNEEEKEKNIIPSLDKGDILELIKLTPSQHFTKPPARFSDSSLVKALEEDGIGRPSTYAPIIYTLIQRDYIRRIKGYFHPTELGFKVSEMLVEYFPKIMDEQFTALMEGELDNIAEGKIDKIKVLEVFYQPFKTSLDFAQANIKKEVVYTEDVCEKCGKPMVVKWGRRGKFLSCSDYPKCVFSKSITSGVKCSEPECGGELIERRSKRGFFYGCSNFPKCRFTSKDLPQGKE
jgi:DNA topoisomerase-1